MSEETKPPVLGQTGEESPPAGTVAPADPVAAAEPVATPDLATNLLYLAESVRTLQIDAATLHERVGTGGRTGDRPAQPRLPEPPKPPRFGGDSAQLRVFLSKARLYLSAYEKADEAAKVRALAGLLDGVAYRRFETLWETDASSLTVAAVLSALEQWFADQNEASDARFKFQHARQRATQSVLEYSNYLDQLVSTPGVEDLRTDVSMFERFWTGIHPSLQRLMLPAKHTLKTRDDALKLAVDFERDLQKQRRQQAAKAALREMAAEESADPWDESTQPAPSVQKQMDEMAAALKAMQTRQQGSGKGRGKRRKRPPAAKAQPPPPGTELVPGSDGQKRPVQCWKCHKWGHYQSKCPTEQGRSGNG